MTRTETAALSLRIAALYLWVQALLYATSCATIAPGFRESGGADWLVIGCALTAALLALAGVLLYCGAPRLAARVAGGDLPMTLEDRAGIGSIATRLAGIVLWDAALQRVPTLTFAFGTEPATSVWTPLAMLLVLAAAGTWAFVRAPSIAPRWFGVPSSSAAKSSTLASIAFASVGLWIFVAALPEVVDSVVDLVRHSDLYANGFHPMWRVWISAGLRLVLGAWLVLGGGVIARAWNGMRSAGLARRDEPV